MRHIERHFSQIPPLGSTKLTVARILDVEAVTLVLCKHSFRENDTRCNSLMDMRVFHIYFEELSYQCRSRRNINSDSQTTKILHIS